MIQCKQNGQGIFRPLLKLAILSVTLFSLNSLTAAINPQNPLAQEKVQQQVEEYNQKEIFLLTLPLLLKDFHPLPSKQFSVTSWLKPYEGAVEEQKKYLKKMKQTLLALKKELQAKQDRWKKMNHPHPSQTDALGVGYLDLLSKEWGASAAFLQQKQKIYETILKGPRTALSTPVCLETFPTWEQATQKMHHHLRTMGIPAEHLSPRALTQAFDFWREAVVKHPNCLHLALDFLQVEKKIDQDLRVMTNLISQFSPYYNQTASFYQQARTERLAKTQVDKKFGIEWKTAPVQKEARLNLEKNKLPRLEQEKNPELLY